MKATIVRTGVFLGVCRVYNLVWTCCGDCVLRVHQLVLTSRITKGVSALSVVRSTRPLYCTNVLYYRRIVYTFTKALFVLQTGCYSTS